MFVHLLFMFLTYPTFVWSESTDTGQVEVWAEERDLSTLPKFTPRCADFIRPVSSKTGKNNCLLRKKGVTSSGVNTNPADDCADPFFDARLDKNVTTYTYQESEVLENTDLLDHTTTEPNNSPVKRANVLLHMSDRIIKAHDFKYGPQNYSHSPRILVCKMYNESHFRPQVKTSGCNSTAGGLTQVTKSTVKALMFGYHGLRLKFRSKIPEFSNIGYDDHNEDGTIDGKDLELSAELLYEAMKKSVALQIEVGLAVMQLKALEAKAVGERFRDGVKTLLKRYYGRLCKAANNDYANKIFKCADCVKKNNNKFSKTCLSEAKKVDRNLAKKCAREKALRAKKKKKKKKKK